MRKRSQGRQREFRMKKITKISMQQNSERYNLFLDDEFFCGISEDTLVKLQLKKGMEVDEASLVRLIEEERKNQCLNYAIWLLTKQNYFQQVLVTKLQAKEYTQEEIAYALQKLNTYQYLDDKRLTGSFVKDKKRFSKKGPQYIRQALRQKGVDQQVITEALEEYYSEEEEIENCKAVAEKKLISYQRKETNAYTLKGKLYGFLMQRGFQSQTITKVLELIWQEKNL